MYAHSYLHYPISESTPDGPSVQQQTREQQQLVDPKQDSEARLVARFVAKGCGCANSCLSQFTKEQIADSRIDCFELTKDELDLVILGQLHASMNSSKTQGPDSKHKLVQRQRSSIVYRHRGKLVCATCLQFSAYDW